MLQKIAFISEHVSPLAWLGGTASGGQNIYLGELAVHLAALGFQVDIYTRWEDPFTPQVVLYRPGVRVIQIQRVQQLLTDDKLSAEMGEQSTHENLAKYKQFVYHYKRKQA